MRVGGLQCDGAAEEVDGREDEDREDLHELRWGMEAWFRHWFVALGVFAPELRGQWFVGTCWHSAVPKMTRNARTPSWRAVATCFHTHGE